MVTSKVKKGVSNPEKAYGHLSKKFFSFIDRYLNYGTNVFDKSWDLLIVLDACRYDLFEQFGQQHSLSGFVDSVDYMYSIASQTRDWLQRTFDGASDSLLSETLYVSGMGWIEEVDTSVLYDVVPAWQGDPPEAITNEAIRYFRTTDAKRFIVHYSQPHAPFLHCRGKYGSIPDGKGNSLNVWNGLREGAFRKEEVWKDYGRNLLAVLDHVETLIRNFGGEIAITADHGNALGEFGLYGHPGPHAAPSIRRVPWVTASGRGLSEYELKPKEAVGLKEHSQSSSAELEQHLRDLGYRG